MTFPTEVNATTGSETAASSTWDLTYPGSISANNILLWCVSGAAAGVFSAFPAGWAALQQTVLVSGSENVVNEIWWKRATGTETGTFNVTSTAGQRGIWRMVNISGVHTSTDPAVATAVTGVAVTAINTPALDPSGWAQLDTLWYAVCAHDSGTRNITSYPLTDGQFTAVSAATTLDSGLAMCRTNSTTESLDPGNFTLNLQNEMIATLVALRPNNDNLTLQMPLLSIPALTQEPTHVINQTFTVSSVNAAVTMQAPTIQQGAVLAPRINAAATVIAPGVFHEISVTRSVIQGTDDGHEFAANAPDLTNQGLAMIAAGETAGIRFENVLVPNSAFVTSAVLNLVLMDAKNDAEGVWYCEKSCNPGTFTTADGNIDGRLKTTASVAWTTNDLGVQGATIQTPNLSALVMEAVAQECWDPGDALVFFYVHNSGADLLDIAAFEHATYDPPSVTIKYLTTISVVSVDNRITPITTMFAPSVAIQQTPLLPDVITASTTMHVPTVSLFEQFVVAPKIDAGAFLYEIIVTVSGAPAASFQVSFQDQPQTASVTDPLFSDGVQDSAKTVEFQDANTALVEDID